MMLGRDVSLGKCEGGLNFRRKTIDLRTQSAYHCLKQSSMLSLC